jgi:hypothetical protein
MACVGVEEYVHSFFTSALDGDKSPSRPGRFTPSKAPPYPSI